MLIPDIDPGKLIQIAPQIKGAGRPCGAMSQSGAQRPDTREGRSAKKSTHGATETVAGSVSVSGLGDTGPVPQTST